MAQAGGSTAVIDKRAVLARHYLFCELDDQAIDRIASLGLTSRMGAGQLLFSKGDEGDALYGVLEGKVRVSTRAPNGREVIISVFEPGDVFGEIALLDGLPRTADARTMEACTLLKIQRRDFRPLLEREPKLCIHLLELLCERLRFTTELIEDASFSFPAEAILPPPLDEAAHRRLRAYRLRRVQEQLEARDLLAAVLFDPCNIRYATDTRNMAVWTLHNHVRCAFVPAQGKPTLFEFGAGKWPVPADDLDSLAHVLPTSGWTHFYAGSQKAERVKHWARDIARLAAEAGDPMGRIAFDHLDPMGRDAVVAEGLQVEDGESVMEWARLIKSDDEIAALRHSIAVAELGMERMRQALRAGLRENELWSILHQTNIAHDGEWIETRLLSSGPRTNPWMQECSDRVIEAGELVAFDTDMIGPYGYCADISRTYFCGPGDPTAEQRALYRLSHEQLDHNWRLFQPGRPLREVVAAEWVFPEAYLPYRYGLAHGVGLKDEFPFLVNHADLARLSEPDMLLQPGMVFSVESYIGAVGGSCGVKLEDQLVVTEDGPVLLSTFPFEEILLES